MTYTYDYPERLCQIPDILGTPTSMSYDSVVPDSEVDEPVVVEGKIEQEERL